MKVLQLCFVAIVLCRRGSWMRVLATAPSVEPTAEPTFEPTVAPTFYSQQFNVAQVLDGLTITQYDSDKNDIERALKVTVAEAMIGVNETNIDIDKVLEHSDRRQRRQLKSYQRILCNSYWLQKEGEHMQHQHLPLRRYLRNNIFISEYSSIATNYPIDACDLDAYTHGIDTYSRSGIGCGRISPSSSTGGGSSSSSSSSSDGAGRGYFSSQYGRRKLHSQAVDVFYKVQVYATVYSEIQLQAQLFADIESGNFTNRLHENALRYNAGSLLSVTSTEIAVVDDEENEEIYSSGLYLGILLVICIALVSLGLAYYFRKTAATAPLPAEVLERLAGAGRAEGDGNSNSTGTRTKPTAAATAAATAGSGNASLRTTEMHNARNAQRK